MIRKGFLLVILAALVGLPANPALAERLTQRVPRGNNVGLGINVNWSMPMNAQGWSGNTIQFPKGSGNMINNDCWSYGWMSARDLDGNGTAEDTLALGSGGRDQMPGYCSIEGYDIITAAAAVQPNMEGHMGEIQYNRVWTSLDDAELAEWPVEGRQGHTAAGEPILHGAETMFVHSGDAYNSWAGPVTGVYAGWTFYFLDFAESNNMVYGHIYFQNVTEYVKYNPTYYQHKSYDPAKTDGAYPAPANGWKWDGFVLFENRRAASFGNVNCGWAFHPADEILLAYGNSPTVSSYTPPEPPLVGRKVLKKPVLRDQEMEMTNVWLVSGNEFGFSGSPNLLASGQTHGKVYRCALGQENFFNNAINPFTGRVAYGWPGLLEPTDTRYNQWLWGGAGGGFNDFTFYGEFHDVAPRDTFNLDFVVMFTYPAVLPLTMPTRAITNIDDPMIQAAFAPMNQYAIVAQSTFEGGFITPATPAAPPLTIIPGDRQVTLTWSDVNLQTADPYYAFLQANPELDPQGVYREYDFEGFRLYRSYVGPNDSHSEQLKWPGGALTSSISGGNLSFFFIDKREDDISYGRMRNGMKVWYALVAYDKNYDPSSGAEFSLPDPSSGKSWNRPGESGLYDVLPRSEANNFRAAGIDGAIVFQPAAGTPVYEKSLVLDADSASGTLVDAPAYLAPVVDFLFTPVIDEKITAARTLLVQAGGFKVYTTGENYGSRNFTLKDGSFSEPSAELTIRQRNGASVKSVNYNGPNDADGSLYALKADFQYMSDGDYRSRLLMTANAGSYTGGALAVYAGTTTAGRLGGFAPAHPGQIRAGRFTLTWQTSGSGLTLQVMDVTRNKAVDFTDIPDNYGWGFVTSSNFSTMWSGNGTLYTNMVNNVPVAERTVKMVNSLPADNTESFGIWINGILWSVGRGGTVTMPAAGTVFTLDNAWGAWSSDRKSFTQLPDPPFPGDTWRIDIKPSTMNAEDANLSKVRVVPNPYIASSFLDLSATQRRIDFVNLPDRCTIRIYTLGGNLVNVLNHIGANRSGWGNYTDIDRMTLSEPKVMTGYDNHGGTEPWNLRNRFGQTIASGLYFFHVTDSRGETHTGKFYVIN